MLVLILLIAILLCLLSAILKAYKLEKEIQLLKQVRLDPTNPLHISILKGLQEKGQIEVLALIYAELYQLKRQLMLKGVIDHEIGYLLGEIYEAFQEFDKKAKSDSNKR